ncbi:MAG: ParB/RepB/Spo0J family partition protein [Alphaproteobacteria bacterium]
MTAAQKKLETESLDDGRKNRLGRGLAALIGDAADEEGLFEGPAATNTMPVEQIQPNPGNPRRKFTEENLEELALSIREKGLLQPLIVRALSGTDRYQIVAGERRWRAAQLAQLHEVPVIIKQFSDSEALEIAIIENVQREDLNPVEEAEGLQRLMEEFRYTQEQLSKVIGKSRSHVANTLRLVNLPDKVKTYLADGLLTAGHARALLTADDVENLATLVVQKGMSVRQAEALVRQPAKDEPGSAGAKPDRAPVEKDADTLALEHNLAEALGLVVSINHRGQKGEVKVAYSTLEQLDEVCRRLLNTGN